MSQWAPKKVLNSSEANFLYLSLDSDTEVNIESIVAQNNVAGSYDMNLSVSNAGEVYSINFEGIFDESGNVYAKISNTKATIDKLMSALGVDEVSGIDTAITKKYYGNQILLEDLMSAYKNNDFRVVKNELNKIGNSVGYEIGVD